MRVHIDGIKFVIKQNPKSFINFDSNINFKIHFIELKTENEVRRIFSKYKHGNDIDECRKQ